jgi:hypothetical protein
MSARLDETQAARLGRTRPTPAGRDELGITRPGRPGVTRPTPAPQDPRSLARPTGPDSTRRMPTSQGHSGGPTPPGGTTPPTGTPRRRRRPVWWHWLVGIPLYGMLVLGVAGLAGYWTGLDQRASAEAALSNEALKEQFDLGVQDLLAQRYELARQRFDYILSVDPNYPGALELLEEARVALNQPTLTPSPVPSPTTDLSPTPTLNLGSLDGLFAAAQAAQVSGDWDGVINALLALRGQSPDYRRQEANQLLYSALRNRGLQKIWNGDQEPGIYDLTLAQRLAPLDSQAQSWLNSAAFYLFANSYFGLDPALATQNFSSLCAAGIWDSCFKFARAAWEYADLLFKDQDDPCAAVQQYAASLDTYSDSAREPTATKAAEVCMTATAPRPTATPTITLEATLFFTETPTSPGVTDTPSGPTPTETPTPSPTPTPMPTETPAS